MKLYVVRHGESEANAGGLFAGWADVDLTSKGEQDARDAGELLRHVSFDRVYSSDIYRAVRTCRLALPEAEVERTALMREYDVGDLLGKKIEEFCKDPVARSHRNCRNFAPYGGEDTAMVWERVKQFASLLEERKDETVALFGHAGTICLLANCLLGLPPEYRVVEAKNGAITVFEYDGARWRLDVLNYRKKL